jgi:hypothetical protein
MKRLTAAVLPLLILQAHASEWRGHLATLFDAQKDCVNTESTACLPYLAEAVAVADVLEESALSEWHDKGEVTFTVVFHGGLQQHCTAHWLKSMNGLKLLHLALVTDTDGNEKSTYWTQALVRASQELCVSH